MADGKEKKWVDITVVVQLERGQDSGLLAPFINGNGLKDGEVLLRSSMSHNGYAYFDLTIFTDREVSALSANYRFKVSAAA